MNIIHFWCAALIVMVAGTLRTMGEEAPAALRGRGYTIEAKDNGFGQDGFIPGQTLPEACHLMVEFRLNTYGELRVALHTYGQLDAVLKWAAESKVSIPGWLERAKTERALIRQDMDSALKWWGIGPRFPTEDPWPPRNFSIDLDGIREKRFILDFMAIGISTVALTTSSIAVAKASKNAEAIAELQTFHVRFAQEFTHFANKTITEINQLREALEVEHTANTIAADLHELLAAGPIIRQYLEVGPPFIRNLRKNFIHPADVPHGLWDLARHLVDGANEVGWEPERYGTAVVWDEKAHTFVMPIPTTCKEIYERVHDGTVGPGAHVPYKVKAVLGTRMAGIYIPVTPFVNGTRMSTADLTPFLQNIEAARRINTSISMGDAAEAMLNGTNRVIAVLREDAHSVAQWIATLPKVAVDAITGGIPVVIIVCVAVAIAGWCYRRRRTAVPPAGTTTMVTYSKAGQTAPTEAPPSYFRCSEDLRQLQLEHTRDFSTTAPQFVLVPAVPSAYQQAVTGLPSHR
jgi:hypothetical protein